MRWGEADREGSMRHGHRARLGSQACDSSSEEEQEETILLEEGKGGLTASPVWSLFSKLGATDTVSLFSFSLPASERSRAISPPLLPNSFLPPYKRRDLNSSFNSPFTSLLKTQSCPESRAPCFPFYRRKEPDYTNHEIQGHCELNAQNHYSIFSF